MEKGIRWTLWSCFRNKTERKMSTYQCLSDRMQIEIILK
jgi:hypothetical protein